MKRVVAACALLTTGFVTAPAGWREDREQPVTLVAKANAVAHFGAAPSIAKARVWLAPDGPGALYRPAITGAVKDHRDAAARSELDSFLATANRATLGNAKIAIVTSASSADANNKQLEALLHWRDDVAGVETHARLVVAGSADSLVAVTGECMFGATTTPTTRDACTNALATLDPGIPAAERVDLSLAPAGNDPPPDAVVSTRPPATMGDGARVPLPPMTIKTETKRTTDRRPVYVGFGIVLLAAVFWWNRRRREREERTDDDR